MNNALYPHPIDDSCPYCRSENVRKGNDTYDFTAIGGSIECVCDDCGKSHHLNYKLAGITLEDENDPPKLVDYHVGYEIPDMSKEGEPDQGKTLVAAIQMADGIFIMAHGYSDGASAPGYGCPVIIEMCEGRLRTICWADITGDDVSDIIDLEQAKLKYDPPTEELRYEVILMTPQDVPVESHFFDHPQKAMEYHKLVVPIKHYVLVVDRMDENKVLKDSRQ